jgi:RHS repeat-associated protein
MTDGAGTQTFVYESVNRLASVTRASDTFSYLYDLAGNLTRRTYPDGTVTDYTYDDDSRTATATSGGQTTSYAYDAAGNVTQTTLPAANGHVEERTYDRAGRLTRVKNVKGASTLSDFSYTLDPVGNPTQVVRAGTLPGTTTYAYDARDRLTEVCFQVSCPGGSDPFIRWTYDAVGNRLSEARSSGTTTYTYNAADELTQAGSTSFGYDQNGNQTAAGTRTFAYDLANRLASTTSGGQTTSYGYDGDGSRLTSSTGSSEARFLWDTNHPLPQLALERDGQGALLRRFLYGRRRLSLTSGGTTSSYHYDPLGSVANVTSANGVSQWTYAYEPFGALRGETQDDPAAPQNPMKFAGEQIDPTALYYLRARQYDPPYGRFLRTDPVPPRHAEPSSSAYEYVGSRPTRYVDPSGRTFQPPDDGHQAPTLATSPELEQFAGGWLPVEAPSGAGIDRETLRPPGGLFASNRARPLAAPVRTIIPCPYEINAGRVLPELIAASVELECPFLADVRFNEMCINRERPPYRGFADSSCGVPLEAWQINPWDSHIAVYWRQCRRGVARTQVSFHVTITPAGQRPQGFGVTSRARRVRC